MIWAALVRLSLAFVLGVAAAAKIWRPAAFRSALAGYRVLPRALVAPAAVLIAVVETVLASALFLGLAVQAALIGAGVLMLVFAAVTASAIVRRLSADCGCLGAAVRLRLGWPMAAANVVLGAAAIAASSQAPLGVPFPASHAAGGGTVAVILATAILLAETYWVAAYATSISSQITKRLEETAR
jgi:hypothetical protein